MYTEHVNSFECSCSSCRTAIRFSLSDENLKNLPGRKIPCPLCGEDMSQNILTLARAVVTYNSALSELEKCIESVHGKVE